MVGELLITPAWRRSVEYVGALMRTPDWKECVATYGVRHDPRDVLHDSVKNSNYVRCAMTPQCTPVAVFGVMSTSLLGRQGSIWMIATGEFDRHAKFSLQLGRRLIPKLLENFDELVNYVHSDNRANLNWLRHMGFEIEAAAPYGVAKQLFHRVTRRAERCAMQIS